MNCKQTNNIETRASEEGRIEKEIKSLTSVADSVMVSGAWQLACGLAGPDGSDKDDRLTVSSPNQSEMTSPQPDQTAFLSFSGAPSPFFNS